MDIAELLSRYGDTLDKKFMYLYFVVALFVFMIVFVYLKLEVENAMSVLVVILLCIVFSVVFVRASLIQKKKENIIAEELCVLIMKEKNIEIKNYYAKQILSKKIKQFEYILIKSIDGIGYKVYFELNGTQLDLYRPILNEDKQEIYVPF